MNETSALEIAREAILVTIKMGTPILAISLVVGLIISLFQALTSIQEQTLTFVPKILVTFAALIFLLPFMLHTLSGFTLELMDRIVHIR